MSRPPADRSHLSIGEVLSLLQGEFPDVTISKIRFLESQGLLDPERTPSGYRKFYDGDIDRLRWILRQQKDHYLPLKVIKDRLDDHEGDSLPPSGPATRPMLPGFGDEGAADAATLNGAGRGAVAVDERPAEPEAGSDAGPTSRRAPAAREAPTRPRAPAPPPLATPQAEPQPRPPVAPARPEPDRLRPAAHQAPAVPGPEAPAAPVAPPGAPPRVEAAPGPDPALARPLAPAARSGATPAPTAPAAGAASGRAATPVAPGAVEGARQAPTGAGVSLTIDELAEASGMTVRDLRELEAFGLLESHVVGDAAYYDADALQVARTAGGFLRHGIEARHLRSYKVAVDREAGLFEQIILPLLKQRNPEAHRRASQIMAELIGLGEAMRGTLLHRELRDHID